MCSNGSKNETDFEQIVKKLMNIDGDAGEKGYSVWVQVFNNGLSKICGRQPLKNLNKFRTNFLKAVFRKFYSVHSWILYPISKTELLLMRKTLCISLAYEDLK